MYVSITGLKPKGLWGLIKFWTLAVPTFREAQVAKGNRISMYGYSMGKQGFDVKFYEKWNSSNSHEIIS